MSNHKDILDRVTLDIEHSVMMEHTSSVTIMEDIKREITSLREFKQDVKDQLAMAIFHYENGNDFVVKGIVKSIIELANKDSK